MHKSKNQEKIVFKKPPFDSVKSTMSTDLGRLKIRGPIDPDRLARYKLTESLCCFRSPCRQHEALIKLAGEPDGLVFTASLARIVVAYVSFQKPDYPWWQKRYSPQLFELGTIETDISWRKMGLSNMLLKNIFDNPDFNYFEDYIVMAFQFVHGWDLKNTGMSPWVYQEFMIRLFAKYNFTTWETVDPEIREHPCNILLARIGKNISAKMIENFYNCCLGTN